MLVLLTTTILLELVEGDYIPTPVSSALQCSVNTIFIGQNTILYDNINNLCFITNSTVPGSILTGQRSFVKDSINKALLFKVTKGYGQSALGFYRDMNAYSDIFVDWKTDTNVAWYKSSLLKDVTKFGFMVVEVTDLSSTVYAWLKFQVTSTDTAESWFNQAALIDSYPWSAANIKSTQYNNFFIGQYAEFFSYRTFHIANWGGGCAFDYGIVAVFEQADACSYVTGTILPFVQFPSPIIGFYNTTATINNGPYFVSANNLRIIGILKNGFNVYNRA